LRCHSRARRRLLGGQTYNVRSSAPMIAYALEATEVEVTGKPDQRIPIERASPRAARTQGRHSPRMVNRRNSPYAPHDRTAPQRPASQWIAPLVRLL